MRSRQPYARHEPDHWPIWLRAAPSLVVIVVFFGLMLWIALAIRAAMS